MNEPLDFVGQLPSLAIFTNISICFNVAEPQYYPRIETILSQGLRTLTASFPWVPGQVVNEGANERSSGIFMIKKLNEHPSLHWKDLRQNPKAPTMKRLHEANFPIGMLDEKLIACHPVIPQGTDEANAKPVFSIQVNLIQGGLILTFTGQHQAMDMTGQGQLIALFAKACCLVPFSEEEVISGNLSRDDLVDILEGPFESEPSLTHQLLNDQSHPQSDVTKKHESSTEIPECIWATFGFSYETLCSLKSKVFGDLKDLEFVSKDDIISALIWQSVLRSRLSRLSDYEYSTLGRAVDMRQFLGVQKTYPGCLQNMIYHRYCIRELVESPLHVVAMYLRSSINPSTTKVGHETRVLASFLHETSDKSKVAFGANLNPSNDLMISSWAKLDCYSLDFGIGLGKPVAVRVPRFGPYESLVYLMPKSINGDIVAAVCLRRTDMLQMKNDMEFRKYAKYIG